MTTKRILVKIVELVERINVEPNAKLDHQRDIKELYNMLEDMV